MLSRLESYYRICEELRAIRGHMHISSKSKQLQIANSYLVYTPIDADLIPSNAT